MTGWFDPTVGALAVSRVMVGPKVAIEPCDEIPVVAARKLPVKTGVSLPVADSDELIEDEALFEVLAEAVEVVVEEIEVEVSLNVANIASTYSFF